MKQVMSMKLFGIAVAALCIPKIRAFISPTAAAHLTAVTVGKVRERGSGKRARRSRKCKAQRVQERRLAAAIGACRQAKGFVSKAGVAGTACRRASLPAASRQALQPRTDDGV